jgi:hypothetical protein
MAMSFWSDAGRIAGDIGASVVGIDGPSDGDAKQHAQDEVNNRGNHRRDEARDHARALAQEADGGYDPAAITKHTNWAGKDHKEIKAIADGLQPGDIGSHGGDWAKLGQDLQTRVDQFQRGISTVGGPKSNLAFHAELLDNPEFVSGDYDTGIVTRMRS